MQQAMKREHPELSLDGVSGFDRLPGRNPCCDHDIAEAGALAGRERQDIGFMIFSAKAAVQRADTRVGCDGHREGPAGTSRGD